MATTARRALPLAAIAAALGCSPDGGTAADARDGDVRADSDAAGDTTDDPDAGDADAPGEGDADVGDVPGERETGDAGASDDAAPPPGCDPVLGSAYSISFLPAEPWDGGSTRASVTGPDPLTNVGLSISGTGPAPAPSWMGVVGSGPYTWSWSLSPLAEGDFCVAFLADPSGTTYQRAPLHVAAGPPPGTPVFKVVANHQWTCEEEYTWAINVDTVVLDEAGAPLPGVRVLVEHAPCETAADHPPPPEVVTGSDGTVRWENYNPRCFFHERVADAPSDAAIEIYTGIWETQPDGSGGDCNYCSTFAENVWGHWSYTITFQRMPATETCEVPGDHAGQSRCSPLTHWEDPSGPCTPL